MKTSCDQLAKIYINCDGHIATMPIYGKNPLTAGERFRSSSGLVDILAHLSHWLIVFYCDRWMPLVCRQQLLQRTSPKPLAGF